MTKTVYVIVGLPGSGKSHLANRIGDVIVDDIIDLSQLPSPDSIKGKDVVVSDVNFCDARILDIAVAIMHDMYDMYEHRIKVLYFENNPAAAIANVEYRNDGRNVQGTIDRFRVIYEPPQDAIPIWQHKD